MVDCFFNERKKMKNEDHTDTMMYTTAIIKEAIDIVVGDDGSTSDEVEKVLATLDKDDWWDEHSIIYRVFKKSFIDAIKKDEV
jgi:hypothetical protein